MESARTQLGEVMGLLRGNLVKIEEREEKLIDMEKRAEKLQAESEKFAVFKYIPPPFLSLLYFRKQQEK